jgi:tetratricopeptide (TPR) repeat protein
MRQRTLAAVLVSLVALVPGELTAEPSFWQLARSPSAAAERRLHDALERKLESWKAIGPEPELKRDLALAAVAMIDLARVDRPKDPALCVLIAETLVLAKAGRETTVRELLLRATSALKKGPLSAKAHYRLGQSFARSGEAARARAEYTEALSQAWDPELRASAYCYRGHANLALGDFAGAIADHRRAVELAPTKDLEALSRYALGLSLERSGDLPTALGVLDTAARIRLAVPPYDSEDPLELPGVFFVPTYDRHYLRGLSRMAVAKRAHDREARDAALESAIAAFDTYLVAAKPDDAFRANARNHRERCQAELAQEVSRR